VRKERAHRKQRGSNNRQKVVSKVKGVPREMDPRVLVQQLKIEAGHCISSSIVGGREPGGAESSVTASE